MALAEVTVAEAGTLEALDALEIVDIKMLRTSGLLLSLDENQPAEGKPQGSLGETIGDAMRQPRISRAVHCRLYMLYSRSHGCALPPRVKRRATHASRRSFPNL
jgi:hypothetical protein